MMDDSTGRRNSISAVPGWTFLACLCIRIGMRGYGFGWVVDRVNDRLIVSHTGNIIRFSSAIERNVDDHLTVILLDNRFDSQEVAGKLAYNIARLYLWTGPHYQPIPDKEPKITDRVRGINDRFDHGKLNAADFTPLMWSELSPWRKQAEQDGNNESAFYEAIVLLL